MLARSPKANGERLFEKLRETVCRWDGVSPATVC